MEFEKRIQLQARTKTGKKLLKNIELNTNEPLHYYDKIQWDLEWNWISQNPNITLEIIESNPNYPWDWDSISYNPNITIEIIEKNPEKPWEWLQISQNPNITMKIIEVNQNKEWNWYCISRNPNITWKIIESNPNKPWDWRCVSYNPNISMEIVKANPDKTPTASSVELRSYKPWNKNAIFLNKNNEIEYRNQIKRIKIRDKIIQSRLEKRIKLGCKYSCGIKSMLSL
jgi:hypothetical protein